MHLTHQDGVTYLRKWHHGWLHGPNVTCIVHGCLADGRWFAERYGRLADADDRQYGACVYGAGEQDRILALRLCERWMRDGEWKPTPAAYDADQQPADGLPWRLRGRNWVLDETTPE